MVTGSLLLTTRGSGGPAVLDARNKLTGELEKLPEPQKPPADNAAETVIKP